MAILSAPLATARRWLHRDAEKVPARALEQLARARAAHPVLDTMVTMREELRQLWTRSGVSAEQLVVELGTHVDVEDQLEDEEPAQPVVVETQADGVTRRGLTHDEGGRASGPTPFVVSVAQPARRALTRAAMAPPSARPAASPCASFMTCPIWAIDVAPTCSMARSTIAVSSSSPSWAGR